MGYLSQSSFIKESEDSIIKLLKSNKNNTYWLYPIIINNNRNNIRLKMLDLGWDIPNGTTQLSCISSSNNTTTTPNAQYLMDHVLYVPIYYLYYNRDYKHLFINHLEYAISATTTTTTTSNNNNEIIINQNNDNKKEKEKESSLSIYYTKIL